MADIGKSVQYLQPSMNCTIWLKGEPIIFYYDNDMASLPRCDREAVVVSKVVSSRKSRAEKRYLTNSIEKIKSCLIL